MPRPGREPAPPHRVIPSMRQRESPWRWPAACGLAFALLLSAIFLVPRAWISFFFSPLDLERYAPQERADPWLVLLPPPEVTVVPTVPASPVEPLRGPEPPPPDWWTTGWRVRIATAHERGFTATADDSAHVLLEALHLSGDLSRLARPDSVIAARLLLLRREDSLRFDELKPYLHALSRARIYRGIQARKADMYDDFLNQDIIVPD